MARFTDKDLAALEAASVTVLAWERQQSRLDSELNLETRNRNLDAQVAHVVSEIGEVYQARKHKEGGGRELDEVADAWLSILGLLAATGHSPGELLGAAEAKLDKLEDGLR